MSEEQEVHHIFIEETQDIIQRIHDYLDGFLTAEDRNDRFNAILRGIHTIKGGAASCGFKSIKTEAHRLETDLHPFKGASEKIAAMQLEQIKRTLSLFEQMLQESAQPHAKESPAAEGGLVLFSDLEADKTPAPQKPETATQKQKQAPDVIRVRTDRIQKNFESIGEIFLTRNQLRHLTEQYLASTISKDLFQRTWEVLDGRLRQNIRDLEQNAMSMRLTSVKPMLRRMESTVRQFSDESGKDIQVILEGEDTEIDKSIVDSLAEPLIHLVRNAMDHGIEDADERIKKGKSKTALISLSVSVQCNEATIDVRDDGRGIDPEKILASAKRKGLNVKHVQTRDDMLQLIFLPGFSTKESVSEVSGRGVGMDAVKTYLDDLGGRIGIATEINSGTTFTMHLPLGMSLVPALLVPVNGYQVAVATADIVEIFNASRTDIVENDGGWYYNLRGTFIPCIKGKDFFYTSYRLREHVDQTNEALLCITRTAHGLVAFQFDTLTGHVELALKPLPDRSFRPPYVNGVSTLATGDAVFVISLSKSYEYLMGSSRGTSRAD